MTGLLREVLNERASDVTIPRFDAQELAARGSRRVVRRRAALVVTGALAVAVAMGLVAVVNRGSSHPEPMPVAPPGPSSTDALDQYRLVPEAVREKAVPLDAGTWRMHGVGPVGMRDVILDVPQGYNGSGPFLFASDNPIRELGYWSPTHVYQNPCKSNDTARRTPVEGVAEMADALAAQRQSRTTAPRAVSVGGYDGLSLELTTDVVPRKCRDKVFYVFGTVSGDRWLGGTGERDRFWILDVEGDLLVLSTAVEPGVTGAQVEELARIVESARFGAGD